MRIAVIFDRYGPYHIARLEASLKYFDVLPIEVSATTKEYDWDKVESGNLRNRITLFNEKSSSEISTKDLINSISKNLDKLKPDAVAINGWYEKSALAALQWCLSNKVPAIVMSESAAEDEKRVFFKEILKKKIVKLFSAGLVGGTRHINYLVTLGMRRENIRLAYDVIDNDYFTTNADRIRGEKEMWQRKKGFPENFFLIVSRFIEKKNLPFVINAFSKYVAKAGAQAWHLYIIGDGHLKPDLQKLSAELGLEGLIHFEGFKQYDELPVYFGSANALIHASTSEQWGLVVNEAMASGLPVIVSERCGCAPELVHSGKNGYAFNPENMDELVQAMFSFLNDNSRLKLMGEESKRIIERFNPDSFGKGLHDAAKIALSEPRRSMTLDSKLTLTLLLNR